MWIVLHLSNPGAGIRGYCQRFLLEPTSNLFVGNVPSTLLGDLESRIRVAETEAVLVTRQVKNDLGVSIQILGKSSRRVIDNDGLQLIARKHNVS